ncbi:MAG: cytochrome c peroxidase [Myxococcota bacterium]
MRSLSVDALPPLPSDPSNRVADQPTAARLGHALFFDARLSSNDRVACATCHVPALFFTDGRAVSEGVGRTNRNAPTVVAAAYSPWLFWDGRRDSLWAQALAPFESAAEMNLTRLEVVRRVARDPTASALYREAFGHGPLDGLRADLPPRAGPFGDAVAQDAWARLGPAEREAIDRAFADVGKALAAYQRRLVPAPARFDRYVRHLVSGTRSTGPEDALTPQEREGLRLFLDSGRTQCLRCHNGALLTNQSFHRIGTEQTRQGFPEFGRFLGLQAALLDPFNCLGRFSDAQPDACRELRFLRRDHVQAESGKFKTPTLRGLRRSAPYMHDGRMATLDAVLEHYRRPPPRVADPSLAHELLPLEISDEESRALVAFLLTLDGEVAAAPRWLAPPAPAAQTVRAADAAVDPD